MSRALFAKYIWILDTIRSRGRISLREINDLWVRSAFCENGATLSRRTFYNYRQAIEETFGITIGCDTSTFEYYIGDTHTSQGDNLTDWLLNSAAMSDLLADVSEISERVFFDDVPSARRYLSIVVKALKDYRRLVFDYSPYSRSQATRGVVIEPYFLKIFRQRWYITGFNPRDGKIKTYALDRMDNVTLSADTFEMPSGFDPTRFCSNAFGIVFSQAEVKNVQIRAVPRQAKYLRTLPLHHSQEELVHDTYSVFTYRLQLTPDFVQEILSHGPGLTVMNPPELKAMVVTSLRESLANYGEDENRYDQARPRETTPLYGTPPQTSPTDTSGRLS